MDAYGVCGCEMNEWHFMRSLLGGLNVNNWVFAAPERSMTALFRVGGFLTRIAFEILLASQFREPTCISSREQIDQVRLESNDMKLQPKLLQARIIVGA